jgi:hypothetical protein
VGVVDIQNDTDQTVFTVGGGRIIVVVTNDEDEDVYITTTYEATRVSCPDIGKTIRSGRRQVDGMCPSGLSVAPANTGR